VHPADRIGTHERAGGSATQREGLLCDESMVRTRRRVSRDVLSARQLPRAGSRSRTEESGIDPSRQSARTMKTGMYIHGPFLLAQPHLSTLALAKVQYTSTVDSAAWIRHSGERRGCTVIGCSSRKRGVMANTEWWQRGPIEGIPAVLQPIAHILLQVRESVGEIVEPLTEEEWNARPARVASAAFHVRHIAGVIDRLFTYGRGEALSAEQFAALQQEGQELLIGDVVPVLSVLSARVDAAVAELRTIDVTTLSHFRGVGRAQLPSTVIGCLVHGAEHAMRHVGQLSVSARIVRSGIR
jgi:hypothetical protein